MTFPRNSLNCKLVSVQYREYKYGLMVCDGPSFWRTMKRNTEETGIFFSPRSRRRCFSIATLQRTVYTKGLVRHLTRSNRKANAFRPTCERANQKPRTANASTLLASGWRKSCSKNNLLAKKHISKPIIEDVDSKRLNFCLHILRNIQIA